MFRKKDTYLVHRGDVNERRIWSLYNGVCSVFESVLYTQRES
jgi:hypothetical protein